MGFEFAEQENTLIGGTRSGTRDLLAEPLPVPGAQPARNEVQTNPAPADYVPNARDFEQFKTSVGQMQTFDMKTLGSMAGGGPFARYLVDNFDTIRKFTSSGGTESTVHMDDVSMLVELAEANRDIKALKEEIVPDAIKSFDMWDTNDNGYLSTGEIKSAQKISAPKYLEYLNTISRNFDVLRSSSKDGLLSDWSISRADLEKFDPSVALQSVIRETHRRYELDPRVNTYRTSGRVTGGVSGALRAKNPLAGFVSGFLAGEVAAGFGWIFERGKEQERFDKLGAPAITTLIR